MRTNLEIEINAHINRETGEVTDIATLANTAQIIGLTYRETSTGFIPGGHWGGEFLERDRAQALAWTYATVSEDGTWTVPGSASDADKERILGILSAIDRETVIAARQAAQARAERVREQLRKIADGEAPRPAFRSKYRGESGADTVVDASTDRLVRGTLGL